MSDKNILFELGNRVRQLRLRHNLTQQQLAQRTLLSLNTIKALESGKAKLATLVVVLRELGKVEELQQFLPDPGVSPMQLAKSKGRPRRRASGQRGNQTSVDKDTASGAEEGLDW